MHVDAFSKYVVIYPIKRAITFTGIRKIFYHYLIKYGTPKSILSDHRTQFTYHKWIKKRVRRDYFAGILWTKIQVYALIFEFIERYIGRFFFVYNVQ